MKKIYLEDGGFPLETKTIRHLSEMTEQVASVVSKMAGNTNVIISGLEEVNGNLTAGWVVIAGELYPVVAGASNTHLRIVENIEQAQYLKDADNDGIGDFIDAYFDRYVVLDGDAPGNFLLEDFVRYENLNPEVLISGKLHLLPSISLYFAYGDFVGISEISQSSPKAGLFEISFLELDDDYFVIVMSVNQNNINLAINSPLYYFVNSETSNSFKLGVRTLDGNDFNNSGNHRFDILLIKKN